MWHKSIVLTLLLCSVSAYWPVIEDVLDLFAVTAGGASECGPCPPVDCRVLPAIVLGYCCGCAFEIGEVSMLCPYDLLCPPISPQLCGDYDYLLYCCC